VFRTSARLIFIICTSIALNGCVSSSSTPYPPSWPGIDVARDTTCDHLGGRFGALPVNADPERQRGARLVYWLAGSNWEIRTRSFSEVELEVHDARLIARVRVPGRDDSELVPTDNWRCKNGELIGEPPLPPSSEDHSVMHVTGTIVLNRATNGALVVHVQSKASGLSMIVPFRESRESWLQYPAIGAADVH
jgi:hypothetical protein